MAKSKQSPKAVSAAPAVPTFNEHVVFLGDTDEFIAAMPAGRDCIVAKFSTFNGRRALDLRRHYLDDANVWRPTSKGVRLTDVEAPLRAFLLEVVRVVAAEEK